MIKPEKDINDITWAYLRDDDLSRNNHTHRIIYILDCLFSTEPEVFAKNILAPMADDALFHPDLKTRLDAYACFVDTKNLMRLSTSAGCTYQKYTAIRAKRSWSSSRIETEAPVSFYDEENKINIKGWNFSEEMVDATVFKERYKNTLHNGKMRFAFNGKSKKRDTWEHINAVAGHFYRLSPNIPLMLNTQADEENILFRLSRIIEKDVEPLVIHSRFEKNGYFECRLLFNENNFDKKLPNPPKKTVFFYEEDFDVSRWKIESLFENTNITPAAILRRLDMFRRMTDMVYPPLFDNEKNVTFLKNKNFNKTYIPYGFFASVALHAGSSGAEQAIEALSALSEYRNRQDNFLNTDEIDILTAKVLRGAKDLCDQDRHIVAKNFLKNRPDVGLLQAYARRVESVTSDLYLIKAYLDSSAPDKEAIVLSLVSIKNHHVEGGKLLDFDDENITLLAVSACFSVEGLTAAQNRVLNEIKNTLTPQMLLHALPAFAVISDQIEQHDGYMEAKEKTVDTLSSFFKTPKVFHFKHENLSFLLSVLAAASYNDRVCQNTQLDTFPFVEFYRKTEWTQTSYWRIGDWFDGEIGDRRPFEDLHQLLKHEAAGQTETVVRLIAPYAEYFNADLNEIRTYLSSALPLYVLTGVSPEVDGSAENMHKATVEILKMAGEEEILENRKYPKNFTSLLTPHPAQWKMEIDRARERLLNQELNMVTDAENLTPDRNNRPQTQFSLPFDPE